MEKTAQMLSDPHSNISMMPDASLQLQGKDLTTDNITWPSQAHKTSLDTGLSPQKEPLLKDTSQYNPLDVQLGDAPAQLRDLDSAASSNLNQQKLLNIMNSDAYNQYCVDCNINLSEMASTTYGIFICMPCAIKHRDLLGDDTDVIKSVRNDHWSTQELKSFLEGTGGNKAFFDYMKGFNLEKTDIGTKFKGPVALYYAAKLDSSLTGKELTMKQPFGDFRDKLAEVTHIAGEKMHKAGDKVADAWEKTGIEKKLKDYFGK